MKISKKSEYALHALVFMARDPSQLYTIQKISSSAKIPNKFLEQILLTLRHGGLLTSRRGAGGGYLLTKDPKMIRLLDVVQIIEGNEPPAEQSKTSGTPVELFLLELENQLIHQLQNTTIEDLLLRDHAFGSGNFEI